MTTKAPAAKPASNVVSFVDAATRAVHEDAIARVKRSGIFEYPANATTDALKGAVELIEQNQKEEGRGDWLMISHCNHPHDSAGKCSVSGCPNCPNYYPGKVPQPQYGWICPKCNEVNSPTAPYCWHCQAQSAAKNAESSSDRLG